MGAHRLTGLISCLVFVPLLDHPYIYYPGSAWELRYYLSGGRIDMSLTGGGTNLAAGGSVTGDIRVTTDVG